MTTTGLGIMMRAALLALALAHGAPAAAADLQVVASIKPIHSLVAGVMQGAGAPTLLVEGAGSPHSYSLRPSKARALAEADLVFWVGPGLETFLIKPLTTLPASARLVALSEAEGVRLLPTRAGGTWQDHAEEEEEEEAHAEADADHADHADHAPGAADLHVWLDPVNAAAMVGAIAAALSAADPERGALYAANAAALRTELERLNRDLAERLAPVRTQPFVVFHDAYRYFEDRYGLNAVGAISVSPERRPGARRLSAIRDRLAQLEAACVFAEPQFEPALVDTVVEGTSARRGVLDPMGAALEDGPQQYFELMKGLADALLACLGAADRE